MSDPVRSWTGRLAEIAVSVLAVALMLSWAWALLRPLLPVIVIGVAILVSLGGVVGFVVRRWRY